jgi:hypothetical protein
MIRISYNTGCRLGNHLYIYAAGRLLARRLGLALHANPIPGFPRTNDVIKGKVIPNLETLSSADPIPSWPDLTGLEGKGFELTHGFVNSRYFIEDRERIKSWLALTPTIEVDPDDVLVNVRLGDFKPLGLVLDPMYYTHILERIKFKNLYLMTDEPGHAYLDCFAKYKPKLITGYGLEHFEKALAFKRIIMSNSTFCWWFTFLSEAKEIYLPIINGNRCGSWCLAHLPSIDLRLDLPEVTHVYNIPNWGDLPLGLGPTEQERAEALSFAKQSKTIFLPVW